MAEFNIDNIERSLEEDLLLDLIETPVNLYTEGVDSAIDIDAQNSRLKSLYQKVKALAALLYMKESTILTVKKEDAVRGSIFYNKDTNCIEYFDGQAWQSNIFGPNSILDSKSFSLTDLGLLKDSSGLSYSSVKDIYVNMDLDDNQILFIVVDGSILDKSLFYIDSNNGKHVLFTVPISVYSNLSYYVMGAESSYSGSIPRYETVDYISDGVRTVYPISYNPDFLITYKSSIMVIVDGRVLKDTDFSLNTQRNNIVLNIAPAVGQSITIKTLYGVVTDFRSSLTYVEQIVEASIDAQSQFKYNGVSDAVKVYWNGKRLVDGKDFRFNYVQKLVNLEQHISEKVKRGDTVIIEKELVPMSKEPMQGVIVTDISKADSSKIVTLQNICNGIVSILAVDDNSGAKKELDVTQYFVTNNKEVTITEPSVTGNTFHISYLTNSRLIEQDIPKIDDIDTTSPLKIWSARKIVEELNKKANSAGDLNQDFEVASLHAANNSRIDGSLNVSNKTTIGNGLQISGGDLLVGLNESNFKIKTTADTTLINQNVNISQDLVIQGNLQVFGTQGGITLEEISVANNTITLNKNLTPSNDPVPSSGFKVNRGRLTAAQLIFKEDSRPNPGWAVIDDNNPNGTLISLQGHKHTISDIEAEGLPIYSSITTSLNTADDFYTNNDYVSKLNSALNSTERVKSLSRLKAKKSALVAGETAKEYTAGTILSWETYTGVYPVTNSSVTKKDSFAIIEDGSIISNSTGALKLPSGNTNKRWDRDNNYCNLPNQTFNSNLDSLRNFRDINGLIRYNDELNCVEMKIEGMWVKFFKPDVNPSKSSEASYNRGRFIIDFDATSFTQVLANENLETFGLSVGEKVFKIQHNLNSLFVRVDIFDDKRTSFPLLYKCIDENNVYVTFPANISDLAQSQEISDWLSKLAESLHTAPTVEGPGSAGKADTSKTLTKKYTAIVTAI